MRNSLDKASADLKKEVKNFADNLYQSMVSLNLFGTKETNNKPSDKVVHEKRSEPSPIKESSDNEEDKDRRIHELEEEIRQLKEKLNQEKPADDET
jgi:predicted RNase H-like nuclease (RuvC/YqgF family)